MKTRGHTLNKQSKSIPQRYQRWPSTIDHSERRYQATPKTKITPSAFKILLKEMLNANGDWSKIPKDYKKPLKYFLKESYPYFLVTDGYFFLQIYFTK
jgi:hypothetical protein